MRPDTRVWILEERPNLTLKCTLVVRWCPRACFFVDTEEPVIFDLKEPKLLLEYVAGDDPVLLVVEEDGVECELVVGQDIQVRGGTVVFLTE